MCVVFEGCDYNSRTSRSNITSRSNTTYLDPEICRCLQSPNEYTSWVRNPHSTQSDTPYISREVHQLDRYLDHTLHNCDEDIWILFSGRTRIRDPEDMTCDRMRDKDHSTKAYHRPNRWDRSSRVSTFSYACVCSSVESVLRHSCCSWSREVPVCVGVLIIRVLIIIRVRDMSECYDY